jgi:hypothetical protein
MEFFHFKEMQALYLFFLIYPEDTAKSVAWVTATFNMSAVATDVSLYSEDQSEVDKAL